MACFSIQLILFLISFIYCGFGVNCHYNDDKKIQVHLVAHTHDDTGWQITVDEYYMWAVQYILDSVVTELQKNPDRKFIYVEIAFFKRWWDEQNEKTKTIVKKLVKTRQLEFINGGWCMNDEASTHYNAIIDQMTIGLRFIEETFGSDARPTVAWHIDPFGHSAEQASLFSMMSFDGFFVGRIDHADKYNRLMKQRMEMVWRGSRNFEKDTQIFTGVLFNLYFPPSGFCFNQAWCNDPPIQDDPNLFDNNVKDRVDAFVKQVYNQAKYYKTDNIMMTMGADFNYKNALTWFKNLDKLIRHVNEDGRVNAFYSTPSIYLKALHEAGKTWEIKKDDFLPYSHCSHCFWTGYFTSRPALKGYIRESNNILQVCKQMEAIQGNVGKHPSSDFLRRSMGVNQHHDAITGTEKQHVTYDYAKRLSMGRAECQELIGSFIKQKYTKHTQQPPQRLHFQHCDYLNISVCHISETAKSIVVNVFNPVARPIITYLKIPVNSKSFVLTGSNGEPLKSQIAPVSKQTAQLRRNLGGSAAYELSFEAHVPPVGFLTYFLNQTAEEPVIKHFPTMSHKTRLNNNTNFIENDQLRLEFSGDSGRLIRMLRKDIKLSISVDQQFLWYEGSIGNKQNRQTSGAYIFRPNSSEPNPVCGDNKAKVEFIKGPIVEEARQIFGPFVSQVIRLYKNKPYAEFEHTIGPIPINDGLGKEIITRFDTKIENKGIFYTDANGREIKKRKRDFRETWKLAVTEPVSENYYPVNSRIFINDSTTQFTVMSDRSQGGSSIRDGQVEIMLHRRLLKDDFLGVGEPLNEPGVDGRGLVTRGKHRVLLSTPKEASRLHRSQGELMLLEPIISFSSNPYTKQDWHEKFTPYYSGLSKALPNNVHLLTMETTSGKNDIILRFEHFFANDEDTILSVPATINLSGLFTDFKILWVIEMNLSANQILKDKKMMQWNMTNTFDSNTPELHLPLSVNGIILKPMEIRTFIARIQRV